MKKSELRKIIRETINEQIGELDPSAQYAPASMLDISFGNALANATGIPNSYKIRCPQGYKFEGFNQGVSGADGSQPTNYIFGAESVPPSTFIGMPGGPGTINPGSFDNLDLGIFVIAACKKFQRKDIPKEKEPHRCTAEGNCVPDPNGPFASLGECENAGCGGERGDRDTQTLDPVNPFVGNTGRPSPGGPLEEIVEKIAKKLKIKE